MAAFTNLLQSTALRVSTLYDTLVVLRKLSNHIVMLTAE